MAGTDRNTHIFTEALLKYGRFNFTEKKKIMLHLERLVKHFLNPLTRNIDFQVIHIR